MPRSPVFWLTLSFFAALVAAKYDRVAGFTELLHFGEPWASRRVPAAQVLPIAVSPQSSGYDGQFYAQLALSPALREPALETALDVPAYRAHRILVPATAHVLGAGQPWLVLNIFALLNVACWLVLAFLLWREIADASWIGAARWLGCVLSLAALDSVRQSLVDLPALLFFVIAVRQHRATRPASTVLALALGQLTKETSFLGSLALLGWPLRLDLRRVGQLLLSVLPWLAWAIYVAQRFATPSPQGLGNFAWPLFGAGTQLFTASSELLVGNLDSRQIFTVLAVIGLATKTYVIWRHRTPADAWWRIGAVYSILLLFLGPWVWSGYWAVCRAVLPLTVAFNLLLPRTRAFWLLWILGNLTLLHGVWRFL